nr:MAG TPA: hypothetical protein [Bacteriophage sp.]
MLSPLLMITKYRCKGNRNWQICQSLSTLSVFLL